MLLYSVTDFATKIAAYYTNLIIRKKSSGEGWERKRYHSAHYKAVHHQNDFEAVITKVINK